MNFQLPTYKGELVQMCQTLYDNVPLVSIDHNVLALTATQLKLLARQNPAPENWDFYLPPALHSTESAANAPEAAYYFYVMASLQYKFWYEQDGEQKHWCYQGNAQQKGSAGMVALMVDLYHQQRFPLLHVPRNDIEQELGPDFADVPMAQTRLDVLTDLLSFERFYELLEAQKVDGSYLLDTAFAAMLAKAAPVAYADMFLKKIQLCLAMIKGNFQARGIATHGEMTVFADYRIPQVLRHLGIITYSPELAKLVDNHQAINAASPKEMAIRAVTIWACEMLAKKAGVSTAVVDLYLFNQSRTDDFNQNAKPFHRTETIDY